MGAIQYFRATALAASTGPTLSPFQLVENSFGIAYKGVAYSAPLNIAVAVGYLGSAYSFDGVTWQQSDAPANQWNSVCWSTQLGLFCAVSSSGTNRVMFSSNGINWTVANATTNGNWREVTWSPELGIFCACRYGMGTNYHFMTSPDGINWTNSFVDEFYSPNTVSWSSPLQLFVSGASSGDIRVVTSPDGINWVDRTTVASSGQIVKVYAHPSNPLILLLRQSGFTPERSSYSINGIDWAFMPIGGGTHVAWTYEPYLDLMVTCASNAVVDTKIFTSRNGINFQQTNRNQILMAARAGAYFFSQARCIFVGDEGIIANNI